ncbi:MAG: hypothetical protein ABSB77_14965, partial [Xanthobacteraceae bacterium]
FQSVSAAAPPWGWRKAIASAESKNTFVPERALQNLLLQHNRPKADICHFELPHCEKFGYRTPGAIARRAEARPRLWEGVLDTEFVP